MSDPVARKAALAELWTRVFVVFTITALVVSLGVGSAVLLKVSGVVTAIRSTQKTNTAVNATNTQLLQIIHSCLTPGQPCYQQALQQRAATARNTRRMVIAVITCAGTLPEVNVATVTRCVTDSLTGR